MACMPLVSHEHAPERARLVNAVHTTQKMAAEERDHTTLEDVQPAKRSQEHKRSAQITVNQEPVVQATAATMLLTSIVQLGVVGAAGMKSK